MALRPVVLRLLVAMPWPALAAAAPPPKALPPLPPVQVVRVGVTENAPYMMRAKDGSWTGMAVELWKLVGADLGLRYELMPLDDSKPFLDELAAVDLYPQMSVRLRNEEQRDLTHAYAHEAFAIAVRDEKEGTLDMLGRLASWKSVEAMGMLALLVALVGVVVWWIERNTLKEDFGGPPLRGIAAGVAWTIEALVGKARSLSRTPRARTFNIAWTLIGVALITGATAKLSAELTVSKLDGRISGPEDLPRVRVGTGGSLVADYLTGRGIRFVDLGSNEADILNALVERRVDAVVYRESALRYFEKTSFAGRIRVLPATFHHYGVAMGLKPSSPLLPHVNRSLLKISQSDAWKRLQADFTGAAD